MRTGGIETLLHAIHAQFPAEPVPAASRIVPPSCDDCQTLASDFARVRWPDVPDEVIDRNYSNLPLFTPEAFHYYLPAYMSRALRTGQKPLMEFVVYGLSSDASEYWQERIQRFEPAQAAVVSLFLRYARKVEAGLAPDIDGALPLWQERAKTRRKPGSTSRTSAPRLSRRRGRR